VERKHQNDIAVACKQNSKHFWKYVKSKTTSKDPINDLKYVDSHGNAHVASTDNSKAEVLCNFFSSVFNIEDDNPFKYLETKPCEFTSECPTFEYDDIRDRLINLNVNKSPGPDKIHPKILVETAHQISYPLQQLFKCSFDTKQLPADWRCANITPLYKKGSRTEIGNYRPVSLTSIICKIMEAIIRDKILSHFKVNMLFTDKQFGFLKGRSTTLQLLQILDKWTECLEHGGQVDVIYTDLEKAFDKIPHRRLISKLHSYCIHNNIVEWLEAFLSNRKQRVRIGNTFSNWAAVISGIPQGSVLGPILFIIYINDLVEYCGSNADIFLFADDAKIFSHIKTDQDIKQLQCELVNFKNWMDTWLLKLNVNKCKSVSYGRCIEYASEYTVSGIVIDKVDKIKDLGIVFDYRLKFDEHIDEKINKAYQMLGIIKRNFIHLTPDSFVVLYKSIVRSHLEYSECVWNPHHQQLIEKLEKVQKRATKLIIAVKLLKYEERLRYLNLPTLKYRRIRGDMIEVYKMFSGRYDVTVTNWFTNRHIDKKYEVRSHRFCIHQFPIKFDMRKFNFTNRVISVWNTLPDTVVSANTIDTFKARLDRFWSDQNVKYNWKSDIITGSRSQVSVIIE